MPTVCLDCRYIRSRPSGIGAVVQALVDHLPTLAPDWRFTFLRHPGLDRPLSCAENVTEVELRAEANGPGTMWWLPQILDMRDIDLFHAPANILPRGLSVPSVTTIHDMMWMTTPELCNPRAWGWIERAFYRHGIGRALRRSDAILTVSEATRDEICAARPDISNRTFAVLPGVSPTFRPVDVTAADLARLGLPNGGYVLAVGQFAPYKNHEGVICGFAAALAGSPGIELVMVQRRGPGKGNLLDLADRLGIQGRTRFVQPSGEEDMAILYSGARALLHPSLCEGYGMPLAEAMACGCPVITSNLSAMPEVTAGAALLVDPRDSAAIGVALRRLLNEPSLADELAIKGLGRAAQLDRRAFAVGNLDVYRHVLASA